MGCAALALGLGGIGSLAGAGLQYAGQQQSKNAMNRAVAAELARQQQYSNQAHNVFNQSLSKSTPQAAQNQMATGQELARSLQSQAQAVPLSYSLPSFGATNTAQQATLQALSNQAQAELQGYGTYGVEQYLKDLQARNQLGVISNESSASAQVMPYEVQAASQRGGGLQALGGLVGSLGGLAGIYGLANKGVGATAMTPMSQIGDYPMANQMLDNIYSQAFMNQPWVRSAISPY